MIYIHIFFSVAVPASERYSVASVERTGLAAVQSVGNCITTVLRFAFSGRMDKKCETSRHWQCG